MKGVAAITNENGGDYDRKPPKDNVILFPKTVDYYQIQLTRMLETERYGDAVELLRFLLSVDSGDPRNHQEWEALLSWMQNMLPGSEFDEDAFGKSEDREVTEEDLLRSSIHMKKTEDSEYVNRLITALQSGTSAEKIFLALGQLTYVDHPAVTPALLEWARNPKLHPYILFNALQALKRRGVKGELLIRYQNVDSEVQIEDTPLSLEDYPETIVAVLMRVQEKSEVGDPTLAYFAEHTWHEFLSFSYASPLYERLAHLDTEGVDVWAAALHHTLNTLIHAGADHIDYREIYVITDDYLLEWKQANQALETFVRLRNES
ncbi:MAG: hypothetical protein H7X86_05115 [Gorillibacterium sp.]|nr:hypothetical protein [Gorillibacterium sp.]